MRGSVAVVAQPDVCAYHGHCERICPAQAISRPFQIVFIAQEKTSMSHWYPDWRERVVFSPDGPQPQILLANDRLKVILAGLEPGQKIPPHPEGLAVYHILAGSGWMVVDGDRQAIRAGATIITPEGATRGMEAETQLAFLATRVSATDKE
jgi:quercetin dioxygenase-like cupin family protein